MRLTVVKPVVKRRKELEPVPCPVCGDRAGRALETIVAPVRRKGEYKWLRKSTKKELVCYKCHQKGIVTVIAE